MFFTLVRCLSMCLDCGRTFGLDKKVKSTYLFAAMCFTMSWNWSACLLTETVKLDIYGTHYCFPNDFAWLPVESIIHAKENNHHVAINASNNTGESTVFIEFMLSASKASLIEAIKTNGGVMDKAAIRWSKTEVYLTTHSFIMNADIRSLCDVSVAAETSNIGTVCRGRKLLKCHEGGHWVYRMNLYSKRH